MKGRAVAEKKLKTPPKKNVMDKAVDKRGSVAL